MNKEQKNDARQQTVERVHTHTHTDVLLNGRKIGIAVGLVIVIVCGVLVFVNRNGKVRMPMALGAVWRNRIGEGAEQEGSDAFLSGSSVGDATSIDMSNWDLNRVNVVYDTEGVPVPVPKGFVASGADGEHTVNTGFVIYEGQGEVNNDNAWDESCSRNQFVWVPVYDTSRVYEEIGNTGKKKAKLWHFTATGRTSLSNDDTSTRMEPGLVTKYYPDMKQSFVRNGMQGYTRETFYKELENSFNQDTNSVERYGGYYIGRYETGDIASEQPVVQRMNIIISNTWIQI